MLKSLYSGVSGMRSQQTKMDVVSNNIANVSTTGFKAGRVRFQDMISQIDSPAQASTNNLGGVNPRQVGMGVQISGTDTIMTGGSLQPTNRSLDFAIQNGDNSFFIVSGSGKGDNQYTRDGAFFTDHNGELVTGSGLRVMGYTTTGQVGDGEIANGGVAANTYPIEIRSEIKNTAGIVTQKPTDVGKVVEGLSTKGDLGKLTIHDKLYVDDADKVTTTKPATPALPPKTAELKLQSFTIDDTGTIVGTYTEGRVFVLGRVALASFSNPDGLQKAGGNLYNGTLNSGEAVSGAPSDSGFGEVKSGFLEMSNVDLANEFTEMIVTSRAYQANSRSITTSDEMIQELLSLKR